MRILLSIKPEHARKIFDFTKKYEFRRAIHKRADIDTVVVYASAPLKKVIGEFKIDYIIKSDIETLYNRTNKSGGISRSLFFNYFKNKKDGYAIRIKDVKRYEPSLSLEDDFKIKYPPQSFLYL